MIKLLILYLFINASLCYAEQSVNERCPLGANEPNMEGIWRCDEPVWDGTPNEVKDSSGNGNDGVRVGNAISTTTAKFGRAGTFDGTGDYVTTTDILSLSSNFTIMFWARFTASGSFDYAPIAKDDPNGSAREWIINFNSSPNTLSFFGFKLPDASSLYQYIIAWVPDTDWHHWAFVGTGSTLIAYRDGNDAGASLNSGSFGDVSDTATPVTIGSATNFTAFDFEGQIDDVVISSETWTANRIEAYYRRNVRVR